MRSVGRGRNGTVRYASRSNVLDVFHRTRPTGEAEAAEDRPTEVILKERKNGTENERKRNVLKAPFFVRTVARGFWTLYCGYYVRLLDSDVSQ